MFVCYIVSLEMPYSVYHRLFSRLNYYLQSIFRLMYNAIILNLISFFQSVGIGTYNGTHNCKLFCMRSTGGTVQYSFYWEVRQLDINCLSCKFCFQHKVCV